MTKTTTSTTKRGTTAMSKSTKFVNGKDFYKNIGDLTAASTNSVKTTDALKRIISATPKITGTKDYYQPNITTPGYVYGTTNHFGKAIVIDVDGYSINMGSNIPNTRPQEVRLNKTPEGAITKNSFVVALKHFRGVNKLIYRHYMFIDAKTKKEYMSADEFFKEVITPMNLMAIKKHRAIKKHGAIKKMELYSLDSLIPKRETKTVVGVK